MMYHSLLQSTKKKDSSIFLFHIETYHLYIETRFNNDAVLIVNRRSRLTAMQFSRTRFCQDAVYYGRGTHDKPRPIELHCSQP